MQIEVQYRWGLEFPQAAPGETTTTHCPPAYTLSHRDTPTTNQEGEGLPPQLLPTTLSKRHESRQSRAQDSPAARSPQLLLRITVQWQQGNGQPMGLPAVLAARQTRDTALFMCRGEAK